MVCEKCNSSIKLPKKSLINTYMSGNKKIKATCPTCGKEYIIKLVIDIDFYIEGDEAEFEEIDEDHLRIMRILRHNRRKRKKYA